MYHRLLEPKLAEMLTRHPVVGLLRPRQVGKTTLAFVVGENRPSIYLDLESPSDRAKLAEPELFLRRHEDKLVIYPGAESYPLGQDVGCVPLMLAVGMLRELLLLLGDQAGLITKPRCRLSMPLSKEASVLQPMSRQRSTMSSSERSAPCRKARNAPRMRPSSSKRRL